MTAAAEHMVRSPLIGCGFTKADVRALAAAALASEPLIAGFVLLPGGGDSDLTISVTLARGYGPAAQVHPGQPPDGAEQGDGDRPVIGDLGSGLIAC